MFIQCIRLQNESDPSYQRMSDLKFTRLSTNCDTQMKQRNKMIDYIYLFKTNFTDLFLERFNNWKQGIHTFRVWRTNKY